MVVHTFMCQGRRITLFGNTWADIKAQLRTWCPSGRLIELFRSATVRVQ